MNCRRRGIRGKVSQFHQRRRTRAAAELTCRLGDDFRKRHAALCIEVGCRLRNTCASSYRLNSELNRCAREVRSSVLTLLW